MSGTTDPDRLDPNPARTGVHARAWFDAAIWTNPEICSECFARLKASSLDGNGGRERHTTWRTPSATLGVAHEEPPDSVPSANPKARVRTTCGECGSVRGLHQSDTLSKSGALDRVKPLVARLQELEYDVDEDVVYDVVRRLKGDPERTADDKHVFATAAAFGVDRA